MVCCQFKLSNEHFPDLFLVNRPVNSLEKKISWPKAKKNLILLADISPSPQVVSGRPSFPKQKVLGKVWALRSR